MSAPTARGGLLRAVGLEDVERELERVDRRVARERQRVVRTAARKTLVAAIRDEAPAARDRRTGVTLRRSISARNGKQGAVIVGPRGGKRGVWFRHIVVGGSRAHYIPRAAGVVLSSQRSGTSLAHPLRRKVRVRGVAGNPFVQRGYDRAQSSFAAALADGMYPEGK